VAGNPRIDDLRRRLEKDPGSRLFAQLAEELRKDGDLEEAINVCREGLKRQPAYPSARMTLGRALFDTGDLAAARTEFETVLKGAADNILASRLLAQCLEGLGDLQGAARQYRTTLALAPGDKQVQAHLDEVEGKLKAPPPLAAREPSVTPPTIILQAPATADTIRAPRPVEPPSDTSPDRVPAPEPAPPPPIQRDYAPIPLVAADETFELEAAHESVPTKVGGGSASAAGSGWVVGIAQPMPPPEGAPAPAASPEPFPMPEEPSEAAPLRPLPVAAAPEEAFEVEHGYESPIPVPPPPPAPAPAGEVVHDFSEEFAPPEPRMQPVGMPMELPPLHSEPEPAAPAPAPPVEPAPPEPSPFFVEPTEEPAPVPVEPASVAPAPVAPAPVEPAAAPPVAAEPSPAPPAPAEPAAVEPEPAPELASATLAELYFNQGFTEKAIGVYRQLVERDPGNERARARITELEALERHLRAEEARGPEPPAGAPVDRAAARRQAIERTIARLEALLAATRRERP
jgi:tetratricopeptide (TPR) repeat protein